MEKRRSCIEKPIDNRDPFQNGRSGNELLFDSRIVEAGHRNGSEGLATELQMELPMLRCDHLAQLLVQVLLPDCVLCTWIRTFSCFLMGVFGSVQEVILSSIGHCL
jgi:hypothetical protein